jgi:hypothetical protein
VGILVLGLGILPFCSGVLLQESGGSVELGGVGCADDGQLVDVVLELRSSGV